MSDCVCLKGIIGACMWVCVVWGVVRIENSPPYWAVLPDWGETPWFACSITMRSSGRCSGVCVCERVIVSGGQCVNQTCFSICILRKLSVVFSCEWFTRLILFWWGWQLLHMHISWLVLHVCLFHRPRERGRLSSLLLLQLMAGAVQLSLPVVQLSLPIPPPAHGFAVRLCVTVGSAEWLQLHKLLTELNFGQQCMITWVKHQKNWATQTNCDFLFVIFTLREGGSEHTKKVPLV